MVNTEKKKQRLTWLNRYVKDDFEATMKQAIVAAEKKCALDFFPVVVERSSAIAHVFPFLALTLTVIAVVSFKFFVPLEGESLVMVYKAVMICLSVWIAKLLSKEPFVQRFLTAHEDRQQSVLTAAHLEYYMCKVNQHPSFIFFVSMMEQQAHILCNEHVKEKVDQKTLDVAMANMLQDLKQNNLDSALHQAIAYLSEECKEAFPSHDKQANQFSDEVKVK